ncbi:hypothetical protein HanXRQr2_Chr11g0512421 [Helianthus annuus]|uniref:Uncharacterized protein n=1 Tax=Helianthus annuus TaxID=4232 RepID=A0A9K3HS82_HELAN|nr:hypothetical protein HanXRQr2_Chr11g0512421 [Helianthus annuus]
MMYTYVCILYIDIRLNMEMLMLQVHAKLLHGWTAIISPSCRCQWLLMSVPLFVFSYQDCNNGKSFV